MRRMVVDEVLMTSTQNPPPARWRKRILFCLAALAASILAAGGAALKGLADFEISGADVRQVEFQAGGARLAGTLILPAGAVSPPVALIVHGDGPQDRFSGSGYLPLINALLDDGIGVFTWDKPGTGQSSGDWLGQSMADRADEALAALAHVRTIAGIDPGKVGFLGFSQAGWVIPRAAALGDPAFSVIIGGAVNWRRQGAYYTEQRLALEGVESDEIARRVAAELEANDAIFAASDPGGGNAGRPDIPPDRFAFVARSYGEDATKWLAAMKGPVLALWGEGDLNVDPRWNAERYSEAFGRAEDKQTEVLESATHGLLRSPLFNHQLASQWPSWKRYLFAVLGRNAYAPGASAHISGWIRSVTG